VKRRLLITDPFTPQSYDVMMQLRDQCARCVVTIPPVGKVPRIFCFSAASRFVTKRYVLPAHSTKRAPLYTLAYETNYAEEKYEKQYINYLLDICNKEDITLIYPTDDYEVLLLAKYQNVFKERNISMPVNSFDVLVQLFDKYTTVRLAKEIGIACPTTDVLSHENVGMFEKDNYRTPRIIKPRFSSAARGVCIINDKNDFVRWVTTHRETLSHHIIQEYIPGDTMVYYRVYCNSGGTCVYASCAQCRRPELLIHQSRGIMLEQCAASRDIITIEAVFKKLNYVGYAHAQFKVNSLTGRPECMEINPRISRGTWTEAYAGINGPLLSLMLHEHSAATVTPHAQVSAYIFMWPGQDIIIFLWTMCRIFMRWIRTILFHHSSKRYVTIPSCKAMVMHYYSVYFKHKKKYSWFFRMSLCDPVVSLYAWISFVYTYTKSLVTDNRRV